MIRKALLCIFHVFNNEKTKTKTHYLFSPVLKILIHKYKVFKCSLAAVLENILQTVLKKKI